MHGEANDHLKYKMTLMTVSTLGLEGHIVAGETSRAGTTGASNGTMPQPFWIHEAYLDYVLTGNTDIKFGRMELDTPLAYTEKWNATANSFEALVLMNTDIQDTTLVGAWVAKGNGMNLAPGGTKPGLVQAPQVFGAESKYSGYMSFEELGNTGGAFAFGAINKSIPSMPIQIWAYDVPQVAQALWAQVDGNIKDLGPLKNSSIQIIGASMGARGRAEDFIINSDSDTKDTVAFSAKVASSFDIFNAYAAFSTIGKGNLPIANTATYFKKTKIPTASIFSDGMVAAQPDTTSWKIGAGAKFDGIGSLSVSYAGYSIGQNEGYLNPNKNVAGPASMGYIAQNILKDDIDLNEFDIVFKTKFKDLDLAFMYINVSETYVPILGSANPTEGYGTLSDEIIRVVASLKF
jgi:hypothetical protein